MEKYCISVDWLQTYCLGNQIENQVLASEWGKMEVKKQPTETAMFKHIVKVTMNKLEVATIQQCPRNGQINKYATLLKISNRVLYSQQYIAILYYLQDALHLTYKGITRIDICYDCNRFAGGRSVPRFLKAFIDKPLGTDGSMYRRGSDKFAAYGNKSYKNDTRIGSVRFGSMQSRIGAYIYNKTVELREVKDKPWIRQMWQENGLVSDEKTHVWRAEISIKAQGTDILNMSSGELFKLSPRYLTHMAAVDKLFYIYARKVFDFRMYTGNKKRSAYKPVVLFEGEDSASITSKPYYISKSADTGRMERICYNKLSKLAETYSDLSEPIRKGLTDAMEFLLMLSGKKCSELRLNRYTRYLDELKSYRFLDHDDKAYFAAMEAMRQARLDYNADELLNVVTLLDSEVLLAIREEERREFMQELDREMLELSYLFT